MARIAGVEIPNDKRIVIALTYVYGIGLANSQKILKNCAIDENIRVNKLTEEQLTNIRAEITKNFTVEGELRKDIRTNISRLMDIASYRGIRHRKGLPVRGQSSKQNARTRKGPRKTVANKKK